ncbi:MAG: hypothetical protein FWC36_05325 [Spirochaetes bacterium]|nr:hypothetical protein [Spirochaetota bacterium]
MNKLYGILSTICIILLLSACFSPWDGLEDMEFTIGTGGIGNNNIFDGMAPHDLRFVVIFTATDGSRTIFRSEGGLVSGTIAPGTYNVSVRVYKIADDRAPIAIGFMNNFVMTSHGDNSLMVPIEPVLWVENQADLQRVGSDTLCSKGHIWSPDAYYYLVDDITWAGSWTPIPNFSGTFNGNGRTINNLNIIAAATTPNNGLFGIIGSGGVVKNFNFINANISLHQNSGHNTGIVAGSNLGTVRNVSVSGIIDAPNLEGTGSHNTGGVIGHNRGTVKNSFVNINLTSTFHGHNIGGVVGRNDGTITHSYATGVAVRGTMNVGGVAGRNAGTLQRSVTLDLNIHNRHSANQLVELFGRVAGGNYGTLIRNYANNAVNFDNFLGGGVVVITPDPNGRHGGNMGATQSNWENSVNGPGWVIHSTRGAAEAALTRNENASPWVWDSGLNRPVLWFNP